MSSSAHASPRRIRIALRAAKVLVALVPVALLGWLLNQNLLVGGRVNYGVRTGSVGSVVRFERPTELSAGTLGDATLRWRMTGPTLHFSVEAPRAISSIRVRVQIHNSDQPGITLSAQGIPTVGMIDRVLDSQFLNQLPWTSVTDGSLTLWQRTPRYPTVAAFIANPPLDARIAVLGIPGGLFAHVPGYQPAAPPIVLPVSLRGKHAVQAFVGAEPLDIDLDKVDLNRAAGADPLVVRVFDPFGVLRQSLAVPDDGNTSASGSVGRSQHVTIHVPGIGPGIVRVELDASEDVLLTNIRSAQPYLAFERQVFLAGGPTSASPPVSLEVRGSNVAFQTAHSEGLQTVSVSGRTYRLTAVKQPISAPLATQAASVRIAIPDVQVTTDGLIVIAPGRMVPEVHAQGLTADSTPDPGTLDFVLAEYARTQSFGPMTIEQTYRTRDLLQVGKRYFFVLNAPGLSQRGATLEIDRIDATLTPSPVHWGSVLLHVRDALRRFLH